MIWLTPSTSSSTLGIWYLFLNNYLLIGFASNANLIESSFFFNCFYNWGYETVTCTFIQLCDVTFCQQFFNFHLHLILYMNWNSSSFFLIRNKGYLNFELTMWFLDIPCRSNKLLNLLKNLFFQPSDCSHMSTSNLDSSVGAGFCVVTIPTCPCKSKPIMHLVLRSVTRNVAPLTSQPADRRFVFKAPNTQIGCLL